MHLLEVIFCKEYIKNQEEQNISGWSQTLPKLNVWSFLSNFESEKKWTLLWSHYVITSSQNGCIFEKNFKKHNNVLLKFKCYNVNIKKLITWQRRAVIVHWISCKKRHTSIGDAYNCCLKHLKKFVVIYLREGKSL